MKPDLLTILSLNFVNGIGTEKIKILLERYSTLEEIQKASKREIMTLPGFGEKFTEKLKLGLKDSIEKAKKELNNAEKKGVKIISYFDDNFPYNPSDYIGTPLVLYIKGNLNILKEKYFAIVGTRKASAYGKNITEKFSCELVENGFGIISGMARGIDSFAHNFALDKGGNTIAVLGCGIDIIYPPENRNLYHRILDNNGAIISQFPLETNPNIPNFPIRNCIISAISLGILVIEAGIKSGALITVAYGLEHGKPIYSVPGMITSANSQGTNNLIKNGAKLVTSIEDILEDFPKFRKHSQINLQQFPDLSVEEKKLYDILEYEPMHFDKLISLTGKNIADLQMLLLNLEFKKLIRQSSLGYYSKI